MIPDEILTDHPDRFRAMIVESGNPVHSLADSPRMREALDALDLVVVIDVAMTETARHADYVLPGGVAVREVGVHLLQPRVPAQRLPPPPAAARAARRARCPSPRSTPGCAARSAPTPTTTSRRCDAAAAEGRADVRRRLPRRSMVEQPDLGKLAPVLLYETLGPTLRTPDGVGRRARGGVGPGPDLRAGVPPSSVRRAGFGTRDALGDALFDAILASPSGVVVHASTTTTRRGGGS